MSLPPFARALDVRAARAAFTAGTLRTIRDHPSSENEERLVELRHADRYDADVVNHALRVTSEHVGALVDRISVLTHEEALHEDWRLGFLARAQYVDPRERRA